MIDVSAFTFSEPTLPPDRVAKIVDVPHSIATKGDITSFLAKSLGVPDYFGSNWDALDECLRDLSWLKERLVVIRHDGVPHLAIDVLRMYLDILARAVRSWHGENEHELVVTFPSSDRDEIAMVARGPVPGIDPERAS